LGFSIQASKKGERGIANFFPCFIISQQHQQASQPAASNNKLREAKERQIKNSKVPGLNCCRKTATPIVATPTPSPESLLLLLLPSLLREIIFGKFHLFNFINLLGERQKPNEGFIWHP